MADSFESCIDDWRVCWRCSCLSNTIDWPDWVCTASAPTTAIVCSSARTHTHPLTHSLRCSDPVAWQANYSLRRRVLPPCFSHSRLAPLTLFPFTQTLLNNGAGISVANLAWEHVTLNIVTLIFKARWKIHVCACSRSWVLGFFFLNRQVICVTSLQSTTNDVLRQVITDY